MQKSMQVDGTLLLRVFGAWMSMYKSDGSDESQHEDFWDKTHEEMFSDIEYWMEQLSVCINPPAGTFDFIYHWEGSETYTDRISVKKDVISLMYSSDEYNGRSMNGSIQFNEVDQYIDQYVTDRPELKNFDLSTVALTEKVSDVVSNQEKGLVWVALNGKSAYFLTGEGARMTFVCDRYETEWEPT